MSIRLVDYTERTFIVCGEGADLQKLAADLSGLFSLYLLISALGGVWNESLPTGPGYVFTSPLKQTIQGLLQVAFTVHHF